MEILLKEEGGKRERERRGEEKIYEKERDRKKDRGQKQNYEE